MSPPDIAHPRSAGIDLQAEQAVSSDRLNWLRAGVLGANDGIVSTAGLVVGVAGANPDFKVLLTACVAGLVAGALSMAVGEYVSVSAQRDTELAAVRSERAALDAMPGPELRELEDLLKAKGLSDATAHQAAIELTRHNALAAHAEIELGIELGRYTNPWSAAAASALAFSLGALVPALAVLLAPLSVAVPVTVAAVVLALVGTGLASARLGGAPPWRATLRNVAGGLLAMGATYAIGRALGAQL
ncbi:MAG: VIT family protein [Rhodocyclaceae bacterium]|nr:VIT family protein [Rhodocyclaceae bacterium]MDQ8001649.1 VIT family protein [Pseudomonadota bacterium]MDQ8017899.1 VIT family protein [Pseudomonadota bacterium]